MVLGVTIHRSEQQARSPNGGTLVAVSLALYNTQRRRARPKMGAQITMVTFGTPHSAAHRARRVIAEQLRLAEGPGSYVHVIVMVSSLHGNETQRHLSHLLIACIAIFQKLADSDGRRTPGGNTGIGGNVGIGPFKALKRTARGSECSCCILQNHLQPPWDSHCILLMHLTIRCVFAT